MSKFKFIIIFSFFIVGLSHSNSCKSMKELRNQAKERIKNCNDVVLKNQASVTKPTDFESSYLGAVNSQKIVVYLEQNIAELEKTKSEYTKHSKLCTRDGGGTIKEFNKAIENLNNAKEALSVKSSQYFSIAQSNYTGDSAILQSQFDSDVSNMNFDSNSIAEHGSAAAVANASIANTYQASVGETFTGSNNLSSQEFADLNSDNWDDDLSKPVARNSIASDKKMKTSDKILIAALGLGALGAGIAIFSDDDEDSAGGGGGSGSANGGRATASGGGKGFPEGVTFHSGADVRGWKQTATLSSANFQGSTVCLDSDKRNVWPGSSKALPSGTVVNANSWVIYGSEGKWRAETFDWMRVGQLCKVTSNIKNVSSGDKVGFFVSGLARNSVRNVQERSNVVWTTWP